jgi:PAS domain-containing protein
VADVQDQFSSSARATGTPCANHSQPCLAASRGVVTSCNDKLAAMFGYASIELHGLPLAALFPRHTSMYGGDLLGRHRDGSALWLRAKPHPHGNSLWVIEDVTETKLYELATVRPHPRIQNYTGAASDD